MPQPLTPDLLRKMHAYWRAANYLSVGQIYLYDNPLLKRALRIQDVKPRLLGHWGTTPGLNFIYVHLNRMIERSNGYSSSSLFPVAFPVIQHQRLPDRFTKAVSSATHSRTLTVPRSTTPPWWSPALSEMARPRPGRWLAAGMRINS